MNHLCSDRVLCTDCPVTETVVARLILNPIQAILRFLSLNTAFFSFTRRKESKRNLLDNTGFLIQTFSRKKSLA